jgi:hypothetical protein
MSSSATESSILRIAFGISYPPLQKPVRTAIGANPMHEIHPAEARLEKSTCPKVATHAGIKRSDTLDSVSSLGLVPLKGPFPFL